MLDGVTNKNHRIDSGALLCRRDLELDPNIKCLMQLLDLTQHTIKKKSTECKSAKMGRKWNEE